MRSWGSETAGHAEQTDRRCQCAVTENHEITKDSRRESKPCGYHKLRRLNIFYNLGAGKLERVRKCCKLVLETGLTYSVLLWLVIQQIPTLFPNIFAEDETLAKYSSSMIRYFFAMLWVMGAQICCQLMFVAFENAKTSLFLALVRKVFLLVPLILLLPLILPDPVVAVYLAEPITDTLACTATVTMFVRYYRKYLSSLQK